MSFQIRDKYVEIFTAAILSLASLLAAWCAYQASAWSGEQSEYAQVIADRRLDATRALARAGQFEIVDGLAYGQWLQAFRSGDTVLADYLRARFRDEFSSAFEAWVKLDPENNPDTPLPFELPEYTRSLMVEADAFEMAANEATNGFDRAGEISNSYVRDTLFTAITLFLGAMAGRFEYRIVRFGLLALATLILITGIGVAAALPIL